MKLPYKPDLLRYPIGRYEPPSPIDETHLKEWIDQIRKFPFRLYDLTAEMSEEQYHWCYRPGGWSIHELIHHCADSHMNAFLRLKWALFENNPTIKPYEEAAWVKSSDVTKTKPAVSILLLDGLHERWVNLLESLSEEDLKKGYFHPESQAFVQLDVYIGNYAWHCEHHYRHMLLALDHEGKYNKL